LGSPQVEIIPNISKFNERQDDSGLSRAVEPNCCFFCKLISKLEIKAEQSNSVIPTIHKLKGAKGQRLRCTDLNPYPENNYKGKLGDDRPRTSKIAIPIDFNKNSRTFDKEIQIALNKRRYDSSTWGMYKRIVEGRSSRQLTVSALPCRSNRLNSRKSQCKLRELDNKMGEEPRLDEGSESEDDNSSQEIFVLDMD